MKKCIACGMPMEAKEDYPLGDTSKDYCVHCAHSNGTMHSFEEKKAGLVQFIMKTQGFDQEAANKMALLSMKELPAWQDSFK